MGNKIETLHLTQRHPSMQFRQLIIGLYWQAAIAKQEALPINRVHVYSILGETRSIIDDQVCTCCEKLYIPNDNWPICPPCMTQLEEEDGL